MGKVTKIKVLGNRSEVGLPPFEYKPGWIFDNDPSCTDYDWLLVYDELPSSARGTYNGAYEPLSSPRERTILATWEPVSIKSYSKSYTRQFGHLLSNRPPEAEAHPHYHLGRGYFYWFNGRKVPAAAALPVPEKTKEISAVCSSKAMRHTRHNDRLELMKLIASEIPGFDWFGRGVRAFGKKYEVMDPYRYHVAVENHIGVHHWTEKLADAFLCECLPFYAGDPAITECFPRESLIPIPLDDAHEAVHIIREAIANDEYAKRREAVLEAKRRVLETYNFWAQTIALIESEENQAVTPPDPVHPVRLYSRRALRLRRPVALWEDLTSHLKRGLWTKSISS